MTKPLRQAMPTVAAWIDALRDAFGAEEINAAIKAGIDGQPTFYAAEGGQQIGTKLSSAAVITQRVEKSCRRCQHIARPGLSSGHCGGGRHDLPPAYGTDNPLRKLPADNGAACHLYTAFTS